MISTLIKLYYFLLKAKITGNERNYKDTLKEIKRVRGIK